MAESKVVQSPLYSAMNNIVKINSSAAAMKSTQRTYNDFQSFLQKELIQIKSIELPEKYKIQRLGSLNIGNVFNRPANLLSGLINGALDIGSFFGNFLGKKGRGGGGRTPPIKAPGTNPKVGGSKLKLGGFKALGIANALFAGLDFSTGLAEGESVGKSAAGTGGALAGSLLGGAIGQTLIPIPGLGFVVGSMAGNFLGGYLADRAYEGVAGGGDKTVEQKTKERLKQQEKIQRERAQKTSTTTFTSVLDKFENVVFKFERSAQNIASGPTEISSDWEQGETKEDKVDYRPEGAEEFIPNGTVTGSGDEVFPLVGGRPTLTSERDGGGFNSPRRGRKHNGQDIGVDPNTPVVASRSGKVIDAYPNGYGDVGGAVVIRYDNGQQGLYGHVTPTIKVGAKVQAGEKIAKVTPDGGNTHLHYMRKDTRGRYIDPAPILNQSKSGVPVIKPEKLESKKDLQKQSTFSGDSGDSMVSKKDQMIPKPTPKQDLSKMSTDQLKGMLDPTMTAASNPAVFKASQEARTKGQESGLTGEALEREVMIASIKAKEAMQVQAVPQQTSPRQIEQYPSYNQPTAQAQSVIMPILMGGGTPQKMRSSPQSGGSGGGGGAEMPQQVPQGKIVNSLLTTILLTNLSSS